MLRRRMCVVFGPSAGVTAPLWTHRRVLAGTSGLGGTQPAPSAGGSGAWRAAVDVLPTMRSASLAGHPPPSGLSDTIAMDAVTELLAAVGNEAIEAAADDSNAKSPHRAATRRLVIAAQRHITGTRKGDLGLTLLQDNAPVAVCMAAGASLVIAAAAPRTIDTAVHTCAQRVDTSHMKSQPAVTWNVYVVHDCFTSETRTAAGTAALVAAVQSPYYATCPFAYLETYDERRCLKVWTKNGLTAVPVAAGYDDWLTFQRRHVDYFKGTTRQPQSSVFFDVAVPAEHGQSGGIPYSPRSECVQLLGGESGSGKTMLMLVGRADTMDLVVYIRLSTKDLRVPDDLHTSLSDEACRLQQLMTTIYSEQEALSRRPPISLSGEAATKRDERSKLRKSETEKRDKAFLSVADLLIQRAVGPQLHDLLCGYDKRHSGDKPFRVRIAFDEAGEHVGCVRAFCAVGGDLRLKLGWSECVEVHSVMGGTGIGSVSNPGGSESSDYTLMQLTPNRTSDVGSRVFAALSKRAENIASLSSVLKAVESDALCTAMRDNPRMAALIAWRCVVMAQETQNDHLFSGTSALDIRYKVLLPVAQKFKSLNGLEGLNGVPGALSTLVYACRFAIFPEDEVGKPPRHLITRLGVLVDNTRYETEKNFNSGGLTAMLRDGKRVSIRMGEAMYVGCYPTELGMYSISPAMVAVLHLLAMGNTEQFRKVLGDTFEVSLASMLMIVVCVFEGRTAVELLEFLFGAEALSEDVRNRVRGCVVAYRQLVLRYNDCPVNMNVLESLDRRERRGDAGAAALKAFGKLWEKGDAHTAWIEISPSGLPSADVVLHIPNALTLAVQCKDGIKQHQDAEIENILSSMGCVASKGAGPQRAIEGELAKLRAMTPAEWKQLKPGWLNDSVWSRLKPTARPKDRPWAHVKLSEKLEQLDGATSSVSHLVPVLCTTQKETICPSSDRRTAFSLAAILAEGFGEDSAPEGLSDQRLRNIRRSLFPFGKRPPASQLVDELYKYDVATHKEIMEGKAV